MTNTRDPLPPRHLCAFSIDCCVSPCPGSAGDAEARALTEQLDKFPGFPLTPRREPKYRATVVFFVFFAEVCSHIRPRLKR